jgi:hypothetical protein|tara:strand:- start:66 stop:341 length:276 start_codon:yes stop_codon:yes gene_type:complete
MELLIGDTIQYKDDDWSYVVREIVHGRVNGEVLYDCIDPNGNEDDVVWCHTVKSLLKSIKDGKISIIKRTTPKPIKNFPKFKFTPKPNYHY